MQTITLQAHVGPDGVLRLAVPVDAANTDLEVVVVVQTANAATPGKRTWPEGYFDRTAGSLAESPISRGSID